MKHFFASEFLVNLNILDILLLFPDELMASALLEVYRNPQQLETKSRLEQLLSHRRRIVGMLLLGKYIAMMLIKTSLYYKY